MTALAHSPRTTFAPTDDLTAASPPEHRGLARDGVRLLVGTPHSLTHTTFRNIGDHLRAGDLLVVNNSRTLNAEADALMDGDWPAVVHFATQLSESHWVVELRTAPDAARPILTARPGQRLRLDAATTVQLLEPYAGERLWRAETTSRQPLRDWLACHGRPIAYGYLDGRWPLADYQTIFAAVDGSAEMPSAARPFTHRLVRSLVAHGVAIAPITLHTGVSSQDAHEPPQTEWFDVPALTARLVNETRAEGGRVIAVGTTAVRALESATVRGQVRGATGWTDLVIGPDHPAQVVNGLVTGLHNPEASHLLLVEAIAGAELTQRAYDEAIAHRYLWHEFGDSCLLLP
jgi:S-adenosylmethionine:tRNA ribosyltransferase-isomerase